MSERYKTDDLRIDELRPLIPPAILMEELPATDEIGLHVSRSREEIARIMAGEDDRLLAVVGPCSIHDPQAALEYGAKLKRTADELRDDELLLGGDSRLSLDSLDALTIALAVKDRYGKHIDGGNETRNALASIATLAQFILADQIPATYG